MEGVKRPSSSLETHKGLLNLEHGALRTVTHRNLLISCPALSVSL